jgi:uncharacterized ion transporter superfamily protein YfcC
LISEYLLIIPVMLALAARLGLSALFGLAAVVVSAKIGYLASVANPVALVIAQPIAGMPVLSGWWLRLLIWVGLLGIGIVWVLRLGRGEGTGANPTVPAGEVLPPRQLAIVLALAVAVAVIVVGSTRFDWHDEAFGAFYITLGAVIAALAGRSGFNGDRDGVDRVDPIAFRQSGAEHAHPGADRAVERRDRPDDGTGVSVR